MAYRKKSTKRSMMRKRRPAAKKVSLAVKSYVNRAIARKDENKRWLDFGINAFIGCTPNAATSGVPKSLNLVPILTQGTTNSQRIGNKISIRRAVVKGHINMLPYNPSDNITPAPVLVKMWLLKSKSINTTQLSLTPAANDFFEVNSGTLGFQGNMLDLMLGVNTEFYTVYKTKTIRVGAGGNTNTFPSANVQAFDNSPFTVPFTFPYTKHLKKSIMYNDNATQPTNDNLFLVFQAVYANGASNAIHPAELHHHIQVDYEDA